MRWKDKFSSKMEKWQAVIFVIYIFVVILSGGNDFTSARN